MSKARLIAITADVAWRKLSSLVEGAALASKLNLEASSPVPMAAPVPPSSHPRPMASSSIRTKRRRLARGVAAELGKRGVDAGAS